MNFAFNSGSSVDGTNETKEESESTNGEILLFIVSS